MRAQDLAYGGALFMANGLLSVTDSIVEGCLAESNASSAYGGAFMLDKDLSVDLIRTSIVGCRAVSTSAEGGWKARLPLEHLVTSATPCTSHTTPTEPSQAAGGGVYATGESALRLVDCAIAECEASAASGVSYGGGLFVVTSETVELSNNTLFSDNVAATGAAIMPHGGTTLYRLPTPAGHWLPSSQCVMFRDSCSVFGSFDSEAFEDCEKAFDACAVDGNDTQHDACPAATNVQPCDWEGSPDLLGQMLYVLPSMPVGGTFPAACNPVRPSASSTRPSLRSAMRASHAARTAHPRPDRLPARWQIIGVFVSESCAFCSAGKYAESSSSTECTACPPGAFCAEGASTKLPCPPGSWRGVHSATAEEDCDICPAGRACEVRDSIAVKSPL